MRAGRVFPFSAVCGQERLKLALKLNAVNPRICGVLISGEKGTAKSTLVRSLADIVGKGSIVEIPLNVTEDRLVGTLDLSDAVNNGDCRFEKGLLADADDNFIYIDEVNLLNSGIAGILSQVISTGENIVERDGISYRHKCRCIPIGSMNPEEGFLCPQLLDRFGLFVNMTAETDIEIRTEIIRRRLAFEEDPEKFSERYKDEQQKTADEIQAAKELLPGTEISREMFELIALTAAQAGCDGNRCEIILAETARALCALRGDTAVSADDVKTAAEFVLPHRMKNAPQFEEVQQENADDRSDDNREENQADAESSDETRSDSDSTSDAGGREQTESPSGETELSIENSAKNKGKSGSGKRNKSVTSERTGRYIRSVIPKGKTNDIAIVPTLCTAALNQFERRFESCMKIQVKPSDFREKQREKRTGATILFVVDASGSMGAKRRMGAVKGAVKGLLSEAYQKRDKVGVIAFRGQGAQVLLNITGSPELAQKCMKNLPTGGKTPLAHGLYTAQQMLKAERIRNPDAVQYMVLISDGKANIPLMSGDSFEDAVCVAKSIAADSVNTMLLDTENGYIRFGFAKKLAKIMNSQYIKLDDISRQGVEENVREFVKEINA